ncbi:MAG: DUF4345 family protein [Pseudomonadota bacterium]
MARAFLIFVGLVFAGYGVACAIDPSLAARLAGLATENGDGFAELGAMYGGLQSGIGVFCIIAGLSDRHRDSGLLLLLLGIGALAVLRGASTLRTEDLVSSYTWGALAFESFVTGTAAALLLRSNQGPVA